MIPKHESKLNSYFLIKNLHLYINMFNDLHKTLQLRAIQSECYKYLSHYMPKLHNKS